MEILTQEDRKLQPAAGFGDHIHLNKRPPSAKHKPTSSESGLSELVSVTTTSKDESTDNEYDPDIFYSPNADTFPLEDIKEVEEVETKSKETMAEDDEIPPDELGADESTNQNATEDEYDDLEEGEVQLSLRTSTYTIYCQKP